MKLTLEGNIVNITWSELFRLLRYVFITKEYPSEREILDFIEVDRLMREEIE